MRKITLLITLILMGITGAFAQTTSYGFSVSGGTYTPITGGTVIASATNGTPTLDSYASEQITLPAIFTFAGVPYTSCYVSSNGHLAFGTTATSPYTLDILTTSTAGNVILAPFSADLVTGNTGASDIRMEQVGSEVVFQWSNFRRYTVTESFSFQIRLNLTTYAVKFVYGGTPPFGTATTYQPQVAIKGAIGDYIAATTGTTGTWAAPTLISTGATSSSTMAFSGSSAFTNGLTYTFRTPDACTGTPVGGTISGDAVRAVCPGTTPAVLTVPFANTTFVGLAYQWQQSANGTDWADVTTGSGATTLSYTPASFAGATIMYRLKTTCTSSNEVVYSTNTVTLNPVLAPTTQATALTSVLNVTSATLNWTNGNGARRLVYVSTSPITDPVSGSTPAFTTATAFANNGQQLVYDGTGTSVTVTGLGCNVTYYVKVFEYNRCGSGPYEVYINTTGTTNAATFTSGPSTATLSVVNNFTGYTGANLNTVMPGWYEAYVTTPSGRQPSYNDPVVGDSSWRSSTDLGTTTAKVNLYTTTTNAWIVSPKIEITADSRVKFKAAITNYGSGAVDPDRMQGTDDKVNVLISTDGCGETWTPIYTFDAENTTALTNQLVDFIIPLAGYTGQTVQIAFQGADGPVDNDPDYDFHIANVVIEPVPACDAPFSISAVKTGFTTGIITWSAPAESAPANGYEYYYSTTNTAPATTTQQSESVGAGVLSASVSGLTANTTYYVWVRSVCSDTSKSVWVAGGSFFTGYCVPAPTSVDGTGITRVTLGTINNPSGSETGNYGNYTNLSTTAPIGATVNFGITYTTGYTYGTKIWVDWNNDADFDDEGELVYTGLSTNDNPTTLSGSFLIPVNQALGGSHVVRIGGTDNNSGGTPCYTADYGSYEDYTLVVTVPTVPVITSFTPENACLANATLTINGTGFLDSTVKVGNTPVQITSATNTQIIATVPAGISGVITVSNVIGTAVTNNSFTVSTPSPIAISAEAVGICIGADTEVVYITQGLTSYDTFVWSPATAVAGNPTDGYIFTPTETTTYTLTASQSNGACEVVTTLVVTVNPLPSVLTVNPSSATVCEGAIQQLTVAGGRNTAPAVVIGNGTTAPGSSSAPNPFSAYYGGAKTQILFTAQELQAQGLQPGSEITSLSFDFLASSASALNDFRIKIGTTTAQNMTAGLVASSNLTTVYNASYTPVQGATGWVPFAFTTPYIWNGGNLVVEVAHNAGNGGNGQGTTTKTTTTAQNMVYTAEKDNVTPAGMQSFDAVVAGSYGRSASSNLRPNITFNFNAVSAVTWAPATSLYTDSQATVPYVEGTAASTVYFKGSVNTSYVATATNSSGCTRGATVTVVVNSTAAPIVENTTQSFCQGGIVAALTATGENIQWYTTATGGQPLNEDTALTTDLYYASQTINGCESATRTAVTVEVTVAPSVSNITSCDSYTLPQLNAGNYYLEAQGQGEIVPAGTVVTQSTTIYVHVSSANCNTESSFNVTIIPTPVITAVSPQVVSTTNSVATIEDIVVTANGPVVWYASEAAYEAGTPLVQGTQIAPNTTYYAVQTNGFCFTIVPVSISEVLGGKDFDMTHFSYYPNPVSSELTISYSNELTSVMVFNMLGQNVLSVKPNAAVAKIDMSSLAEGTYVVNVTSGGITKAIKVVKR